ncbi:MAG: hypothetical protein JRE23_00070 [Deltaproteobacteria bacterium]|nr:hypothetical protein [Deltaproteobacteria bacterium]
MDNIIKFPTKLVRNKIAFEEALKKEMSHVAMDAALKDELTQRMTAIWEKYQFEYQLQYTLPLPSSMTQVEIDNIRSSITKSIQGFHDGFYGFLDTLLTERIAADRKLFFMEHNL